MKKSGRYKLYGTAILLTLSALLIILYASKIYPFGDRMFIWADGDQYFAIENYFASIAGKNDIFYSWSMVLGGNVLPQLAYYSFSPFNLLYILLRNHIVFAVHVVAYLKIILASISFCYCLDYLYDDNSILIKAGMSMCYAFMGYIIYYGWNTSWLDGVILLPIMYVGIHKLIRSGQCLQYYASLALAVISNFYIGYMLCICSVLLYLTVLWLRPDGLLAGIKKTIIRYVLSSLLSAALSMFILLPTALGLPGERRVSIIHEILKMHSNLDLINIMSGFFTGAVNTLQSNTPIIYIGMFPIILVVVLFVCKKVPLKTKLVYGGLIAVILFSFKNSFINIVWHGLSKNAWYNFRYSFFLSFVLLIIAYEAYLLVKEKSVRKSEYIQTGIILLIFALLTFVIAKEHVRIPIMYLDIALIICILALLFCERQSRPLFTVFILAQMIYCSSMNGYCYLKDNGQLSKQSYYDNKAIVLDAMNCISDESLYRMEKTFSYGRCDPHLFNYRGVTNYASTENTDNLVFVKQLGVIYGWLSGKYTTDMSEATESLLGIKYILTDTLHQKDYKEIGGTGNITYYYNPHALPVLFPADSLMSDSDADSAFEIQNDLWKSIFDDAKNVFQKNRIEIISTDENKILEVAVDKPGSVYINIPWGSYSSITIDRETEDKTLSYTTDQAIYYAGEFAEGEHFHINLTVSDDSYELENISCYSEDKAAIAENAARIKDCDMNISETASSHLEAIYKGDKKFIATTIPFNKGWSVYDNGRKLNTVKNWSNFLSFELDDSSEHHITLKFVPDGFRAGMCISVLSLIISFIYEIYAHRKLRRCVTQNS